MGKIADETVVAIADSDTLLGTDSSNGNATRNFLFSVIKSAIADPLVPIGSGSFFSTVDQTVVSGAVGIIAFENARLQNGVSVTVDGSFNVTKIEVAEDGTYNIDVAAQVYRTSSSTAKSVILWIAVNGVDVAYTAQKKSIQNAAGLEPMQASFQVALLSTDYAQVFWTQDSDISLEYTAADGGVPNPASPSASLTVTRAY